MLETLGIWVLVARGRISLLLVRGRGRRLLLHKSFKTRARIWHVRWDCPQRQGSQDFGIAQSQLAVEHESIRFIPPHPSTGQRSQFHFRGAIRTPSVAQVGQRSLRVGRGQVQDSQAGTSSQAGQTICFFCRQPRHMRRDCPRRQRSHGAEVKHTEQSDM